MAREQPARVTEYKQAVAARLGTRGAGPTWYRLYERALGDPPSPQGGIVPIADMELRLRGALKSSGAVLATPTETFGDLLDAADVDALLGERSNDPAILHGFMVGLHVGLLQAREAGSEIFRRIANYENSTVPPSDWLQAPKPPDVMRHRLAHAIETIRTQIPNSLSTSGRRAVTTGESLVLSMFARWLHVLKPLPVPQNDSAADYAAQLIEWSEPIQMLIADVRNRDKTFNIAVVPAMHINSQLLKTIDSLAIWDVEIGELAKLAPEVDAAARLVPRLTMLEHAVPIILTALLNATSAVDPPVLRLLERELKADFADLTGVASLAERVVLHRANYGIVTEDSLFPHNPPHSSMGITEESNQRAITRDISEMQTRTKGI